MNAAIKLNTFVYFSGFLFIVYIFTLLPKQKRQSTLEISLMDLLGRTMTEIFFMLLKILAAGLPLEP